MRADEVVERACSLLVSAHRVVSASPVICARRANRQISVQPHSQKYSGSLLPQITCISFASRPNTGALRDRHERRAGDAMDAARQRRMTLLADGEVVWS